MRCQTVQCLGSFPALAIIWVHKNIYYGIYFYYSFPHLVSSLLISPTLFSGRVGWNRISRQNCPNCLYLALTCQTCAEHVGSREKCVSDQEGTGQSRNLRAAVSQQVFQLCGQRTISSALKPAVSLLPPLPGALVPEPAPCPLLGFHLYLLLFLPRLLWH